MSRGWSSFTQCVLLVFSKTQLAYVLRLQHFLTPIIASLDTPQQLLDRNELTSVFHNFIDIWNLHRSFYSSLSILMNSSASTSSSSTHDDPPRLSPILLSHFPYLSLYTPFVSSFSDALTSYHTLLSRHTAFSSFMATQEADPRCAKLKFRDWMLTIVQRCPRYLLLLKDLISSTSPDDPEYYPLTEAQGLICKSKSTPFLPAIRCSLCCPRSHGLFEHFATRAYTDARISRYSTQHCELTFSACNTWTNFFKEGSSPSSARIGSERTRVPPILGLRHLAL
jgi:hypothetical protein